MMNKQTVYDLKPEGKVVYIRVDYNVPHDKEGNILDDRRNPGYNSNNSLSSESGRSHCPGQSYGKAEGRI